MEIITGKKLSLSKILSNYQKFFYEFCLVIVVPYQDNLQFDNVVLD